MPTPFGAEFARMEASLDDTFGERFLLRARAAATRPDGSIDVNARAVADPAAPLFSFVAILTVHALTSHPVGRNLPSNAAKAYSGSDAILDAAADAFEGQTQPSVGDRITRIGTGDEFKVETADRTDMGRTFMALIRLKAAP